MSSFNLTMNAVPLSLAFEGGFKPKAWLDKVARPPVWTIGTGLTEIRQEDGTWRPVRPDDKIDEAENEFQTHHFFREKIEPPLAKIFSDVPLQPHQRDALASIVYNAGPGAFPKTAALIQDGAPVSDILDEWVDGEWNGALGLYRRRLMEAIIYGFGWPWENAYEVTKRANWSTNWRELVGSHVTADDPDLFEAEGAEPVKDKTKFPSAGPVVQLPLSWNEMTPRERTDFLNDAAPPSPPKWEDLTSQQQIAFLNNQQLKALGGAPITPQKAVINAPKIDVKQPPKAMEDSKTHKGLSKKESGQEAVTMGTVVAGGATAVATIDSLTRGAEKTQATAERAAGFIGGLTLETLVTIALVIGVPLIFIGLWRWYRGQEIAIEGRAEGTQAKV